MIWRPRHSTAPEDKTFSIVNSNPVFADLPYMSGPQEIADLICHFAPAA